MAESKYAKHILKQPIAELERDGRKVFKGILGMPQQLNAPCQFLYSVVTKPHVNEATPHFHEFPIVMSFIGANPNNINDFDAEIEFYLGGEKQVITTTAIISVPPRLPHCPLVFKRIGKPVVFVEVMLTDNYLRTEVDLPGIPKLIPNYPG